ncbi:TSL-kinase interacting protein 1 [Platanthera guangdongensis]|uniref:TSL-kinase interacting protein 1 n=1 Tax=Platanthera guangdongensis TaxID=2320717 RepID=A0ABR2LH42_9ASPA
MSSWERSTGIFEVLAKIELWNVLHKAELISTKYGVHDKTIIDPSMKDNSNKDAVKTAEGTKVKSKAIKALTCRQSGKSVQKVSKKRRKATASREGRRSQQRVKNQQPAAGKNNKSQQTKSIPKNRPGLLTSIPDNSSGCLRLPSTPKLHPKSPVMTSSIQNSCQKILMPVRVQCPPQIQKFQLQLFPIDESTRKFMEEENHCPYLELTITTKKKIASVIKHLDIKWGHSRTASEELILFPYNARVESLENSKRWSLKDSYITAAEVHATIGKPALFPAGDLHPQ